MSVVVNSCGLLINCVNMFPLEFLVITKGAEAFIYEWRVVHLSLYELLLGVRQHDALAR
jgi:hypothetical protein